MNKDLLNKRLSKTKKIGWLLGLLPFVRCVILNGSLAQGKSKESSDIDILIIAKRGRIFTARFFVNSITTYLWLKRSSDEKKSHAGKYCFNYFLSENYLKIGFPLEREQYCADNYSQSQFINGDRQLFSEFLKTNTKLFEKNGCKTFKSEISCKHSKSKFQSILEIIFGKNWFEQIVKKYQINKIESDPRTKKYPERIVYNDKEMRFHPPKA